MPDGIDRNIIGLIINLTNNNIASRAMTTLDR